MSDTNRIGMMATDFALSHSSTPSICPMVRVARVVDMALRAMSLASIVACFSMPSQKINSRSDSFKMIWVHAASNATEMIDALAWSYRTVMQLIGHAVCMPHFSICQSNRSVPIRFTRSHPYPASRFCDWYIHRSKSLKKRSSFPAHVKKVHSKLHPVCKAIVSMPIFGLARPALDA
jgi:hypothetical protein